MACVNDSSEMNNIFHGFGLGKNMIICMWKSQFLFCKFAFRLLNKKYLTECSTMFQYCRYEELNSRELKLLISRMVLNESSRTTNKHDHERTRNCLHFIFSFDSSNFSLLLPFIHGSLWLFFDLPNIWLYGEMRGGKKLILKFCTDGRS